MSIGRFFDATMPLIVATSVLASCAVWSLDPLRPDPVYCDEKTPCGNPSLPHCNLVMSECVATTQTSDAGIDAGPSCHAAADCNAAMPVCEASQCRACTGASDDAACAARSAMTPRCAPMGGACVACRADTQAMDCMTATAPVCGTDNTCRGCRMNAECTSGACLFDGSCAPAGKVAFVDNGGKMPALCAMSGTHDGSAAHPYCDVKDALTAGTALPYIEVAGSAIPYGAITIADRTVTLLGPGGSAAVKATIVPETQGTPAVVVNGMNTTATIDGMEITSATMNKPGVLCLPVGTAALTVRRASIHNNDGGGIDAKNCTVTVVTN